MIAIREQEAQNNYAFLGNLSAHVRLAESTLAQFDNLVNPLDAYIDADGTQWMGIGTGGGKGKPATDRSGFANEQELAWAREACRLLPERSEFVKNGHEVRINYAVDDGFVFKAAARDASKDADSKKVAELQAWLDGFLKANQWPVRQREVVMRYDRDGEVFRRVFQGADGTTKIRFVEPWQVKNPPDANDNTEFGIETDPDDVETIKNYYIADTASDNSTAVDAAEIQHVKANVDMNVRRGCPLFWPAVKNARRSVSVLRNVGAKIELAAAMCLNRRHDATTGNSAISGFTSGAGALLATNLLTGVTQKQTPYGPGSILDTRKTVDYEALNLAEGIGEMVLGHDAMLRALAACAGLPEFMLTSNAANGNYASTMVAEGPAVRTFRTIQSTLKTADLELIEAAVVWAVSKGVLPADILEVCEIQVELPQLVTRDAAVEANANKTYHDMRVVSKQTICAKLGLIYDREQENIEADEKEHPAPQPEPLGGPLGKAMARGQIESFNSSDEIAVILERGLVAMRESDEGEWRTINGAHVLIGSNGKIKKGPAAMVGKHPGHISGDGANADTYDLEPPHDIPKSPSDHIRKLSERYPKEIGDRLAGIVERMPKGARERLWALKTVNVVKDYKEMTEIAKRYGRTVPAGHVISGMYGPSGDLLLSATDEDVPGKTHEDIYTHEIAHAVDGRDRRFSDSSQWKAAHAAEAGSLTKYAGTNAHESFAEAMRFLYRKSAMKPAIFKARLPKMAAALESFGLMPGSAAVSESMDVAEFNEVFDPAYADGSEGASVDVLLPPVELNA